jgi:hypothetical protein
MGGTDGTRGVICSVAPGPACASHVCGGYMHMAHGTAAIFSHPTTHCLPMYYSNIYHDTGARLNHGRRNLSFPLFTPSSTHLSLSPSLHPDQTGLARAPPRTSAQPRTRKKHPPPPPAITLQLPATPYGHLHPTITYTHALNLSEKQPRIPITYPIVPARPSNAALSLT